ncbi:MAG TPA: hypothetical protein VL261_10380 [Nitrospira sp.]|jgi:hypothetical protein|nr:hypothetical protein [Nitrospira sp.]
MDVKTDAAGRAPYLIADRSVQLRWSLSLCVLSTLLMQGCPSKPPAPAVRFPITSGSHTMLPAPDEPILVWSEPPLADLAVEWLRAHHYTSILMPHQSPFEAHPIAHNFSTRRAALAVAREMRAKTVIVLEEEATKEALIEPNCGARFHVSIEIRGQSVEGQETTLRGYAHYPHCVDTGEKTLRSLACQAFATAWGFRPSGQLDIPSSLMCTAGQTQPIPFR